MTAAEIVALRTIESAADLIVAWAEDLRCPAHDRLMPPADVWCIACEDVQSGATQAAHMLRSSLVTMDTDRITVEVTRG